MKITANDPRCGIGQTAHETIGQAGSLFCTHTVNDPPPTRTPGRDTIRVAPICHGNGINGPRIQLVYMYVEGQPNNAAKWVPRILNDWIPAIEGSFRSTSAEQGREIGMRLHMPNCKLSVDVLQLSEDDAHPDGGQVSRARNRLFDSGINTEDRKFHIWLDAPSPGYCGIASVVPFPAIGDNPTQANLNNFASEKIPLSPQVAISNKVGFNFPGWPKADPTCWGNGAMGAQTEAHEILHTLGAVQPSAPNSNGLGHCRDEIDIMCYSEGGIKTVVRCATRLEQLDCGSDDYFNARPQVGSYLSTHWNIANSRYLDASPIDNVPAEIPRL